MLILAAQGMPVGVPAVACASNADSASAQTDSAPHGGAHSMHDHGAMATVNHAADMTAPDPVAPHDASCGDCGDCATHCATAATTMISRTATLRPVSRQQGARHAIGHDSFIPRPPLVPLLRPPIQPG